LEQDKNSEAGLISSKAENNICQTESDTTLFERNVKQRTALYVCVCVCVYSLRHKYTASSIMRTHTFAGLRSYCVLELLGIHVHTCMPANKYTTYRDLCMHKHT